MITLVFNHFSSESAVVSLTWSSFACVTYMIYIVYEHTFRGIRPRAFCHLNSSWLFAVCLLRFFIVVCSMVTVLERCISIYTSNPGCVCTSFGFSTLLSCNQLCALYSCRARHCQQILPGKVAYCCSISMHSICFYMLGLPISSDAVFLRLVIIRNITIFIIDKWMPRTFVIWDRSPICRDCGWTDDCLQKFDWNNVW